MASHWICGYSPESISVGSLLVRVVTSKFFCEYFDFTLPVTIPPVFHTFLLLSLRCAVGPASQPECCHYCLRHHFTLPLCDLEFGWRIFVMCSGSHNYETPKYLEKQYAVYVLSVIRLFSFQVNKVIWDVLA